MGFYLAVSHIRCVSFLTVFYQCLVHYDHVNGHSELVIERVSKDDSGTYTCMAENNVGTIKSLGFVYVKGKNTRYLTQSYFIYVTYNTLIPVVEQF